jgi:hypothetical protein
VGLVAVLAILVALAGLFVLAEILILWLTGRNDPPRRED